MPEQSIGMSTGSGAAFGDGNVGAGYPNTRMTAMETKTFGDGVLFEGSELYIDGGLTSNITIYDGAAIVGGFFYENTVSVNISVATVANGTYELVILANDTAGAVTVTRSASGTTVAARTVRLCIATSAQLTGLVYLKLADVVVAATLFNGLTLNVDRFCRSTGLPIQAYASLAGGSATLTTANVGVTLANYSSSNDFSLGIVLLDEINGTMEVNLDGMYLITAYVTFSSGTTGSRLIEIKVNGTTASATRAAAPGTGNHSFTQTALHILNAGDIISISCLATLASQSATGTLFSVARV